jgi:hypothetical protein
MYQAACLNRSAVMQRLLQCIENEGRMCRPRHLPDRAGREVGAQRPALDREVERDATALDVLHDGERARNGDGIEHHGDLQCAG